MPKPTVTNFKPGPIHYVALGDSTGVGVGARNGGYAGRLFRHISARRPGSRLTNLCVSGATTAAVIESQLDQALATNANLMTVGIGINDIGHGLTVEEFGKNYEVILSRLKSDTDATIVVTNIPDISTAPRIPDFVRRRYPQLIMDFNQRSILNREDGWGKYYLVSLLIKGPNGNTAMVTTVWIFSPGTDYPS